MTEKHKRCILYWIIYSLALQVMVGFLESKGIVLPVAIDVIYVLIQAFPLQLLLFSISRNADNKPVYRRIASIMFVIGCIAIAATVLFPILGCVYTSQVI